MKQKLKRVVSVALCKWIRENTRETGTMLWTIRPSGFWNNLTASTGLGTLWSRGFLSSYLHSSKHPLLKCSQRWFSTEAMIVCCSMAGWQRHTKLCTWSLWDFLVDHEKKRLLVWAVVTTCIAILFSVVTAGCWMNGSNPWTLLDYCAVRITYI